MRVISFSLAYNLSVNNLSLKSLERGNFHKLCNCVKLLLSIFILVTLSGKTDTNAVGNILHSAAPNELVKLGIDTDVLGSHGLLGELLDFLNGTRSSLLESNLVGILCKVDGVVTRDEIGLGFAFRHDYNGG
jgi:hypothetical protein